LYKRYRTSSEIYSSFICTGCCQGCAEISEVQCEGARLSVMVVGTWWADGYYTRYRTDQMGFVESDLWCLGLCQELRQFSRSRNDDVGMGRYNSGKARKPPL